MARTNSSLPSCCGRIMGVIAEMSGFVETRCATCRDILYVKQARVIPKE